MTNHIAPHIRGCAVVCVIEKTMQLQFKFSHCGIPLDIDNGAIQWNLELN